ncbi:L-aspartate oxidase [Candidatus Methylomirabilis limnetica]|uniref:L-aspartate oxidase n=1 Tax=Candidatus Methylomirabilis limnetica TaxID=2033718 RepID=A0A2T4TW16_9BACT|nr:L-aspartate oxidase [Candidatus Methylomirabilis limnetica]PTL35304.1 L-aspartate oxidase [Candidatus Methylomirabilis limnetica]
MKTDILIIGSGLAGCAAALAAAKQGAEVTLLTRSPHPEESSTFWAQGGIIYQGVDDSPQKLVADIVAAGAGLSSPEAASLVSREGPRLVKDILIDELGVPFDESSKDSTRWDLTAEAAHSLPRILHQKDRTGSAIQRAFIEKMASYPRVKLLCGATAVDLLTISHHSVEPLDVYKPPTCIGAYVLDQASGEIFPILAKETILATGGLGRVFLHTTNPAGTRGDGIAMAYRAGARCINMQYVQFHPTTFFHPSGRFLISEAMRGEGARLVDGKGREFMNDYHPDGSLAPRDVVARGIHQMMLESGEPCAHLDISHKPADQVRERFPGIYAHCLKCGIDMTKESIPVVPAAHYSCGGVAVDEWGRSNLHRLRAVGEVACSGLHGANRLASTSLLECLVWGTRAGEQTAAFIARGEEYYFPQIAPWRYEREPVDPALIAQDWLSIQQTMWNYVGLVRSEKRLNRAHEILRELHLEILRFYEKAEVTDAMVGLRNGIQTALAILLAAMECRQSLGCHYRID